MGSVSTVTDILSAAGTIEAGKAQQREAETAALAEEAAGVSREADRKARLADALASQNAAAGASGIAAFEGSPLTIMKADIAKEGEATKRDIFQTNLNARTLRARGRIANKQAQTSGMLKFASAVGKGAAKTMAGGAGGGA